MKRKTILPITLAFSLVLNAFSQKLPEMFVPRTISDPRIARFSTGVDSKFEKLRVVLPNLTTSFIYSYAEIDMLLSKIGAAEGLRVYLAVHKPCADFSLPATVKKNKIMLLFSPGNARSLAVPEQFFFIDENDGRDFLYEIADMSCIRLWRDSYTGDEIQDILRTTLIANDPDNRDDAYPGKYFDTKSIFYKKEDLAEAITLENRFPHRLNTGQSINIDYLKFSLSAHDNIGQYPRDQNDRRFRKRILLDIDYMYKIGNAPGRVFHFEDLANIDDRLTKTVKMTKKNNLTNQQLKKLSIKQKLKILQLKGIDNGQLCPTYCP